MATAEYKNQLIDHVNMDASPMVIKPNEALYRRNLIDNYANRNNDIAAKAGENVYANTPFEGNYLLPNSPAFPTGNNYAIGTYEFKETNELYVAVYNSGGSHFIYVIDGYTATQTIVYKNALLNFQVDPRYFLGEGSWAIKVDSFFDERVGKQVRRTYLIITDNYGDQRFICKEDSIATNSYSTSFFTTSAAFYNPIELINLGLRTPQEKITFTPVAPTLNDQFKDNKLINKVWQFRISYIDQYNRPTEHGIISDPYIPIIGGGCISNNPNFSRCIDLKVFAGNPMAKKINIEFRVTQTNDKNLTMPTDWYLYDTINKYETDPTKEWYTQSINPNYSYNSGDNTFTYRFCGDKAWLLIDPTETSRVLNPLPILSQSVTALDRCITLSNNTKGREPINPIELAKISFSTTAPADNCAANKLCKIVVYVSIWNPLRSLIGRIFRPCEGTGKDYFVFGTYEGTQNTGQAFPKGQEGFIGYLAGTDIYTIGKQVLLNVDTGDECQCGPWVNAAADSGCYPDDVNASRQPCVGLAPTFTGPTIPSNAYSFFIKFEFNVAPGTYIFRIADHLASPSEQYWKTSTFVYDKILLGAPGTALGNTHKELLLDCSDGSDIIANQRTSTGLMIYDLHDYRYCRQGYVREDEVSKRPIELAPVSIVGFTGGHAQTPYTDHNGFYFSGASGSDDSVNYRLLTIDYCGSDNFLWKIEQFFNYYPIVTIAGVSSDIAGNDIYVFTGAIEFPVSGRRLITGTIILCNTTIGIKDVLVIDEFGAYARTDTNGDFEIIAHNRYGAWVAAGDNLVISQNGQCQIRSCNDCIFGIAIIPVAYKGCGTMPNRNTDIGDITLNLSGINLKGLQNGGRYQVAMICHDWMGRPGAAQTADSWIVDIPATIKNEKFGFSTLNFTISNTINLPDWVKGVSFGLTKNLNFTDFLTWTADQIQFVDNTGNTDNVTPTQIRVYYGSLNEYNKNYGYLTNTSWQFITDNNGTSQVQSGDQIEFILNGNGTFFFDGKTHTGGDTPVRIIKEIQYDLQGQFISFEFDEGLKGLTKGAIIKLLHQNQAPDNTLFFEVGTTWQKITANKPTILTGSINAFDAYYQSREIPQPVPKLDAEGQPETNGTSGNNNAAVKSESNGIIQFESYDSFIRIPAIMEHHSPSDFWGDHAANRGRVFAKDPDERQVVYGTDTFPGGNLVEGSNLNGLGYFDEKSRVIFDDQGWGAITSVVNETGVLLFICEADHFISYYKTSQVNVDDLGNLTATSAYGLFNKPEKPPGQNFGCALVDKNSIRKYNGKVWWVDRKRHSVVMSNFGATKNVEEGQCSGYLYNLISNQNIRNQSEDTNIYFVGGIDPKTNLYYLTSFNLSTSPIYINNDADVDYSHNDTLAWELESGKFKGFVSFTPECYGALEGLYMQKNFFSFKAGKAWVHHSGTNNSTPPAYNNFYGTQCKKYLTIVSNLSPDKVKRFKWIEVYCQQHIMYSDYIITTGNRQTQQSRILPGQWDKRNNFYTAPFLCDINTPNVVNPVVNGDPLVGRWAKIRLLSKDADDGKYCEITTIATYVNALEKSSD